jgi:hypothetical protein
MQGWIRTIFALVVVGMGIIMTVHGHLNRPKTQEIVRSDGKRETVETGGSRASATEFKWGIVITGIGAVLLLLTETSKAEKQGYNF